jgi:ParB family chromosome partitioning protein
VIQPVLVRRSHDGYELIAGERRLRAAKRLNLEKIPAIVKDVTDIDMFEISLIENIQREELNPIEEANAFEKLISEFKFTQDRIAQVLGKDKSTISNTLRLLALPKKIQDFVIKGSISAGHARALLSVPSESDQIRISNMVIKDGLSVRETEALVSRKKTVIKRQKAAREQGIVDLEEQLQHLLGTRVRIYKGANNGYMQIDYYSTEDLNRIIDLIISKRP